MADVWQNEHERAGHDGEEVSALPRNAKDPGPPGVGDGAMTAHRPEQPSSPYLIV